ncbi:hypothetical protein [Arsenophonus sp.]|uniref:hypothetical protein n=1 Tax=Arsenophonus sp. TaxID=1872640 RepID=UPI00285A172B|nr:hypothetical protein [Arsenophonus sp.]MDR5616236.1 hypothetical protein [Arsenophonus sp.]
MKTIDMNTEYEKLANWFKMLKAIPAPTFTGYNDSKIIASSGEIIGAQQDADLAVSALLYEMNSSGASPDKTAEELVKSPANALAMMSTMAMTSAGYNATKPNLIGNVNAYATYTNLMRENPFLMISSDRAINVNYQYENYNDLIDKVVNIFEGISGFDKNKIKKSVTDLAKAALSHAELKNTDTTFTQGVIDSKSKNDLNFYINTSNIELARNSGGNGKNAPADKYKSRVQLNNLVMTFHTHMLDIEMAKMIVGETRNDLKCWLCRVKTPNKGNKDDCATCLDKS